MAGVGPVRADVPVSVEIAPLQRVGDLAEMDGETRDAFAAILLDVLARLDRLYGQPLPYMLWLNQRPAGVHGLDARTVEQAWFNVEIVSPWRGPGVSRFIAAAEVASDEYFNPVVPEDLAERLRAVSSRA
jgi:UDPglucose--hexose-1-phosphate uridylyltransferase